MNATLPADAGRVLLPIARQAIASRLRQPVPQVLDAPWLAERRASFVTLTAAGKLRGCIGSVRAKRKLGADVRHNALAAAFSDPRFRPVTASEYPGVHIEVSVLTEPEPLMFADRAEALAQLRPELDGALLNCNGAQATFLPQVWRQLPDPDQFMDELLRKARLSSDYWGADVKLARYQVQVFEEQANNKCSPRPLCEHSSRPSERKGQRDQWWTTRSLRCEPDTGSG